ncbi:putative Exocyst complex component Sec6 [Trypanosoma vivax]|nr:putative Exocyst complex component Sec6 [Trypanosoma vivax]
MSFSQLVDGHRARQIVKESGDRVRELRTLFVEQSDMIARMEVSSGDYDQLRELYYLRSNVTSVIEWVEMLKELRSTSLYKLIEKRQFAAAYKRLCRLQSIRCAVMDASPDDEQQYDASFDPYFENLDGVQTMFVSEVYKLFEETSMHAAINKALEDVPRSATVTETIPEFTQLEECVELCATEVSMESGFLSTPDGERLITEEKISAAVSSCVSRLWHEEVMMDFVDPVGQCSGYLEQMKKVSPLLAALEITLIPLSTKFPFFATVVSTLHSEVVSALNRLVDTSAEVGANDLLVASDFVQWYRGAMMDANYGSYVDLDFLNKLSAIMMTEAVDELVGHLVHLCRSCANAVLRDRDVALLSSTEFPVTTGPKDMFAVLQQTLGGLSTAIETGVMQQIGRACAAAIECYLMECRMHSDYHWWEAEEEERCKREGGAKEDWTACRLLFLYAFCNDCSVIERNMDTVELKFVSSWDDEQGCDNTSAFDKVRNTMAEHVLYYIDEIVMHVERLVENKWELIFRSKEWYDDDANPMQVIVDTLADYVDEEFSTALGEPRARMATRRMMPRFVHKFLTTLMEFLGDAIRHPKSMGVSNWHSFVNCFARDISLALDMWSKRVTEGRGQLIKTARQALELMKSLLSVEKPVDFDFIVQKDLLDGFGDCPSFVVHFLIQARQKVLGTETCGTMLSLWEERIAHQQRGEDDIPTAGWFQAPSFLGELDRTIASIAKRGNIFGPSPRKKRIKAEQQRQQREREKSREQHLAYISESTAAAARARANAPPKKHKDESVEVVSLAELLGQ